MDPATSARARWRPWTFLVPLCGPPLLLAAVRRWDPAGDRGLANVLGTGLGLVLVVLWLGAFARRSGYPRRVRLGLPLAVVGAALLALALLRVEGVRGDMVPVLRWRLAAAPGAEETPAAAPADPAAPTSIVMDVAPQRDWPGFLGANRDALVPDATLALDWDAHPPRLLWRAPIGPGWSAFAVANGWAVTLEQVEGEAGGERVTARSARTGAVAWSRSGGARFTHGLGGDGPRATPTIADGRVVVLGARGWLACLDGRDGSVAWELDLLERFGITPAAETEQLQYGRSSSPLVTDGRVIVPVGGPTAGLVAFDLASGAVLWEGPPRTVGYSSPERARLGGVEQVVVVNEASVSGHALSDGTLLWEFPWPGNSSGDANASQPLVLPGPGPEGVLVSKGYGGGALRLDHTRDEAGFHVRERWRDARVLRTKFTSAVRHGAHLYGLDDGLLSCVTLADGRRVWKDGRYGHGQVLRVGDALLVGAEDGRVVAVAATPDAPDRVLGEFQAFEGKCWAAPAVADGLLLWRSDGECGAWELPRR